MNPDTTPSIAFIIASLIREVGYDLGGDWGGLLYLLVKEHSLTPGGAKVLLEHLRDRVKPGLPRKGGHLQLVVD